MSYGRRTWDEAEYAERARVSQERRKEQPVVEKATVRGFFEARREQLDKVDKFNRVTFVGSMNAKEASFFCDVCNRRFKDDLKFVEHLNSKEHLVNSGFSHESELQRDVTLDQVKQRLAQLKSKLDQPREAEQEEDFAAGVEKLRHKHELEQEKKRAKKRKRKANSADPADADDTGQDEMKKMMGFANFNKDEAKEFHVSNLADVSRAGLSWVTLAFLTNNRFDEIEDWIEDVRQFPGNVILSIGGATGEYPSDHHSVEREAERLIGLVSKAGFKGLDLDIEGEVLKKHAKVEKLAKIVHDVQTCFGRDFHVSLTLPVEFEGALNEDAVLAIQTMKRHRVSLKFINGMIMDYYTKLPPQSTWGRENIRILTEMNRQLCSILRISEPEAWKLTGLCPMIGYNDDHTVFTLDDWNAVLEFARAMNVGLVTYWAINRDQATSKRDLLRLKKNVYAFSNAQTQHLDYCHLVQRHFG
ncbi:hypothetical protein OGAPHI_003993 [Ogataea philodendri]|uniref:C2H2-type domain-containing protein n=1 Tax=Ogataea philodendri TaxID=1378263 RepID=A0A9P8P5X1_9ASCO|nr:uncharacterized protein OGAPHI_003993 [Ogataea philodendri]KAH3665805.1 hypothetical protein OGAPHI_003993 [Ogataea philodendri]